MVHFYIASILIATKIFMAMSLALNFISKSKIEDTIEELKGKLEDISKRREKSKTKEEETVLWCLEIRTDERIKTLQELLDKMDQNQ